MLMVSPQGVYTVALGQEVVVSGGEDSMVSTAGNYGTFGSFMLFLIHLESLEY